MIYLLCKSGHVVEAPPMAGGSTQPSAILEPTPTSMPSQPSIIPQGKGICLLSLDGGGSRALSQLKILADLMHMMNFNAKEDEIQRPRDVFNMIGGTGSGGFIAILLVILKLTADEALDVFAELSVKVLDVPDLDVATRGAVLEDHVHGILEKHELEREKRLVEINTRPEDCKLIVPVSYKDNVGAAYILRNFETRQEKANNLTIAQAMMATLSTPSLFPSISVVKDFSTFEFVSGELALGNPAGKVIIEAHAAFKPEEHVTCILSLGSSYGSAIGMSMDSTPPGWNHNLTRLVINSEQKAEEIDAQMGHLGIYHRFRVTQGLEMIGSVDPGIILTHTSVYLTDVSISRKMELCVKSLRIRDGVVPLEQLVHSGGKALLPTPLPQATDAFIMRKEPWEFIEKALFGGEETDERRMLVVTGLGGCGKTQIVLKFMRQYKEKFSKQFFINGSSEAHIRADIIRHVRSLSIEHSQWDLDDCLLFLSQKTSSAPRLLVYDNVDDPEIDLLSLIPQGDGCVIMITSRNYLLGDICPGSHLKLDKMSIDESLLLLFYPQAQLDQIEAESKEEAILVAEELNCLPIALQQARSYTSQTRCSFGAYLERLYENRKKLLDRPLSYSHDSRNISTYASFAASFERITVRDKQFLRLLSCVHCNEFPLDLLNDAAQHNFSDYETKYHDHEDEIKSGQALLKDIFLLNGEWDVTNLDDVILSVRNYSLINLLTGVGTTLVQMHSLLHEWIRSCIPEQELVTYQSAAVLLIALGAREDPTSSARYLAGHVTQLSSIWDQLNPNESEAFASILQGCGSFQDAVYLRERVVTSLTGRVDLLPTSIIDAKALLASTYRELGNFTEAEKLQQEVLQSKREILGELHGETLAALSELALIHRELDQFDKAEALHQQVLRLRRETDGERHPETIKELSNLALIHLHMGQFKKAEALQREVVKSRKEIFGKFHPDTINASVTLAVMYRNLERFSEAEALMLEVLKMRKGTLGERHPLTVDAKGHLSTTYRFMKRFVEAVRLQEDVLKFRTETLGTRHPSSLEAANNMADLYHMQGRVQEALNLQEDVVKWSKEALGEDSLGTAEAMITLAEIYESLGRRPEALTTIKSAITIIIDVLGEEHPFYEECRALASRVRPSRMRRLIARLRALVCRA
ncbi:hypothetical protein M408DRAFT_197100 [Serendipita vermifera MAFF 305830]|uniref:PNPLA domain-containing protein n=1 Tax=Serendipita vermifera MAFF 305830 TaxID=933852 RepID=A0A0C3B3W9_SERVB|nr:hypothetical protein M408DRAFT_197100 [Serendipita vermifera MAFF 305830]